MNLVNADIDKYVNSSLQVGGVNRQTLRQLVKAVPSEAKSIAVIGFSDYAKHLINIFGDRVRIVWDQDPGVQGFTFRNVPVVPSCEEEIDLFVVSRHDYLYTYKTQLAESVRYRQVEVVQADVYNELNSRDLVTETQTPFYQDLFSSSNEPPYLSSMMNQKKIVFLVELLRGCMHLDGDIVEIGVWQGGSAYYLANALKLLQSAKTLYLFDFFEEHPSDHPKGIMCDDELQKRFSLNHRTKFVSGDIRKSIKALDSKPLCFVHYDMGFQKDILDVVAPSLVSGGIILLDNYGHLAARPGMFDNYFADRYGLHVCRVPYTEQALLIKNN